MIKKIVWVIIDRKGQWQNIMEKVVLRSETMHHSAVMRSLWKRYDAH